MGNSTEDSISGSVGESARGSMRDPSLEIASVHRTLVTYFVGDAVTDSALVKAVCTVMT